MIAKIIPINAKVPVNINIILTIPKTNDAIPLSSLLIHFPPYYANIA